MSKVLVLYYSSHGHVEQMAMAVAEGTCEAGASVDIKRVPETVRAPRAADALWADAVAGRVISRSSGRPMDARCAQGKVGAAFTSTASQHGGQETTLFSAIINLLHFGMVVVGLPYSFQGLMGVDDVHGGTP